MALRLSAGLAQRIVDRVSPIINHNVNIMDPTGLIVAAVNAARVGTMHEGARQAAESGHPVVVHKDDPEQGVQQGVNLPFHDEGHLLGVVGITGPPESVEIIARLVLALVELTVFGEGQQGSAEVRAVRDRDFLVRLVHDTHQLENGSLNTELSRIPRPWRLTVFLPLRERGASAALATGLHRLESIAGADQGTRMRVAQFLGALWVLSTASGPSLLQTVSDDRQDTNHWSRLFVQLSSTPCTSAQELSVQTRLLRALVKKPSLLPKNDSSLHVADLTLEAALSSAKPELLTALAAPARALNPILIRALEAFLDSNGNVSETARALDVHRNSVINQLARISELTGLETRESSQLQNLRVALVSNRAAE